MSDKNAKKDIVEMFAGENSTDDGHATTLEPCPASYWQAFKFLSTDYTVEIHKYPAVKQKVNTDNGQSAYFGNTIYSVYENILLDMYEKVPPLHQNNTLYTTIRQFNKPCHYHSVD